MKYIIQGSHVKNVYEVVQYSNTEEKHVKKPEFAPVRNDKWEDLLSFECDRLDYNTTHKSGSWLVFDCNKRINISETEEVTIVKQIFRADKAITYLQSDKILSEKEDKETNWKAFTVALAEYRDYVFEKYPAVKEYCELHFVKDELENIDKIKDIVLKEKPQL